MTVEWYTPSAIIEAARQAMGSIDCDPASCEEAQETVKAGEWFSKEQNGLSRQWKGNVWLNPPFNNGYMPAFVKKAIDAFANKEVGSCCILFPFTGRAAWHRRLFDTLNAICFVSDCTFGGTNKQNKYLIGVGYMGNDSEAFTEAFAAIGPCYRNNSK